jgi:hypothetical protein
MKQSRDRDSLYLYFQKIFYEYLNPPSEMSSDLDGLIWRAAQELSDEAQIDMHRQLETCRNCNGSGKGVPGALGDVLVCGRCRGTGKQEKSVASAA